MAGRTFTANLIVASTSVDGSAGGSSVQLDPPLSANLGESRHGVVALVSTSVPVPLPLPSTGQATWLALKVLDTTPSAVNAPRLLVTSGDGTAQVIPFAGFLAFGSPLGAPPITALALKGICTVEFEVGG
jgi:hypothetical protein